MPFFLLLFDFGVVFLFSGSLEVHSQIMELFAWSQIVLFLLGRNQLIWSSVFRRIEHLLFILWSVWLYIEYRFFSPLFPNLDIVHVNIDDGVFVILCAKKLVFLFHLCSLERLNSSVVKRRRTNISIACMSSPQMLLQQQVVGCRYVVVFICFNAPGWIFQIKVEFRKFSQDVLIDGHSVVSNHDATVQRYVADLLAPGVGINFFQGKPFGRVDVENFLKEIFEIVGDKAREDIFAWKNLLVELGSIVVFKWQVSTHHCEKDHSTTPNIHFQSMIFFARDHLRRSIARRSTSCF